MLAYIREIRRFRLAQARTPRRDFWLLLVLHGVIWWGLYRAEALLELPPVTSWAFLALVIPPTATALIRRLHDTDRSGWLALLGLIPILGWLILLYLAAQRGVPYENEYGPPARVRATLSLGR